MAEEEPKTMEIKNKWYIHVQYGARIKAYLRIEPIGCSKLRL